MSITIAGPTRICGGVPLQAAGSSKHVDRFRCLSSVCQQMAEAAVPLSETTVPLGEQSDAMSETLAASYPAELARRPNILAPRRAQLLFS